MLSVLEAKLSKENIDLRLALLKSQFQTPFEDMKRIDIENSYHAWLGWQAYLKGPPLRPTKDPFGRLASLLKFLKGSFPTLTRRISWNILKLQTNARFYC